MYRSALQQNIDDALSTRSRAHNFVGALFQVLRILLPREGGLTRTLRACLPLDIDGIDEALHTRYTEHIQRLSQVVNGPGSRTGLYFRVVGTHVLGVVPSFYSCRLSHGVLVRFLRFRLGCHHLRIHTGRWLPPLLPHSQRTCLRCSSTVVDDEAHCLFMCEHPTIVEARDLFLAAVVPPVAALSSLRYADFWALSATGCVPLSALVKYVAVCVRVCWYCHQSGGTDVVDLPDILLPAGQYLDLFDSESETDVPSDSSDEEFVEARDLFLAAVVPPVAALSSLRYADFWALSATGCVPLSALVKYVAVCVRVCWYCHQSGGTDVVDLPDILLPAGQYLDLFDSESETDVPSDSSDEELVEV